MFDFRKYTAFPWFLLRVCKGLLQSLLICIVVLCFPHINIACIHMRDESKRSNAPNVCHRLSSISWMHGQVCSQTIEYRVYQYEPNFDIIEQFVSKLLTILQQISFLLPWIGSHPCMASRLWVIVGLFCSPIRNIFPRISWHDFHGIGPWGNVRVKFPCTRRYSGFEHAPAIVHNIFACLTFSLSATQMNVVKRMMSVPQINVFHEYFPHWVNMLFLTSHFCIVHIHRQEESIFSDSGKAFLIGNFVPTVFQWNFLGLPFPLQSCQRMTVQIPLKRNDWVSYTGTWFWAFVSRWTYSHIWTFRFGNFQ